LVVSFCLSYSRALLPVFQSIHIPLTSLTYCCSQTVVQVPPRPTASLSTAAMLHGSPTPRSQRTLLWIVQRVFSRTLESAAAEEMLVSWPQHQETCAGSDQAIFHRHCCFCCTRRCTAANDGAVSRGGYTLAMSNRSCAVSVNTYVMCP